VTALDGVRVVDTTSSIAGAVATMFLADFGADVVKIEPPDGDALRTQPGFAMWGRNKRSVVIDLRTVSARERMDTLLGGADVWVSDDAHPPPSDLSNEALIRLQLPAFTDRVPWAGGRESDELLASITGVALRQASFEGGPIDSVYPHLVTVQGIWAAAAVTAALLEREQSGLGQVVTVAGIHGVLVAAAGALTFDATASAAAPARPGGAGGSIPFYRTYRCADAQWLFLAALTPVFTARAFEVLGLTSLFDDPRLEGKGRAAMLKPEHAAWVIETIADVFATRPREDWLQQLSGAGCPAGALLERDDWLDHPQLDAIGMRVEIDDPARGHVVMPGIPIQFPDAPARVRTAAPALGQHDLDDIRTGGTRVRPGTTDAASSVLASTGGPLDGIRVIDLGAIIAGPFAGSLLGELGADVIKVEPLTGDSFRGPGFGAYNKGQRSLALDLRHPDGQQALLDLARTADVVIDNYRPGVLQRLGIGYEQLRVVNPRIITFSITGFGEGGPLGGEAGFDPVLQAMSGMMNGQGGDDDPVFFTVPVNDVAAAASTALGVCLALFHRERTGAGQRGWTSLAAMSALLQADALVRLAGRRPARRGGRDHLGSSDADRFHRVADGWVRVQGLAQDDVPADLLDELPGCTRESAVAMLSAQGVPAAPARWAAELAGDAELFAFGALHRDPRPGRQGWVTAGRHARFSRTERRGTLVAPSLGEHTDELLAEAGYENERIEALLEAGVAVRSSHAANISA
jgi:crotonobetainyl-CoA:carnitine CoA-transferase CaiB-like acyl-CoA transferase